MADIVALPGCGPLVPMAELGAVPAVVEALERTLVEARRGEIRAVAIALVRDGGLTGSSFALAENEAVSHQLAAATAYLHHRYVAHKLGDSEVHEFEPSAS